MCTCVCVCVTMFSLSPPPPSLSVGKRLQASRKTTCRMPEEAIRGVTSCGVCVCVCVCVCVRARTRLHNCIYVYVCVYSLQVAQHRDIIQNEFARLNVAKGKLETLCRELQKHNKQVVVSNCTISTTKAWLNARYNAGKLYSSIVTPLILRITIVIIVTIILDPCSDYT